MSNITRREPNDLDTEPAQEVKEANPKDFAPSPRRREVSIVRRDDTTRPDPHPSPEPEEPAPRRPIIDEDSLAERIADEVQKRIEEAFEEAGLPRPPRKPRPPRPPEPEPEPKPKPKPKPKPPKPEPEPEPEPEPDEPYVMGVPTGTIPLDLNIAYGRGAPWSDVTRHNEHHIRYGLKYGVPPEMLESMEVIESGGQSIPNGNGYPNWGIMQLTHSWNGGSETKWEAVGRKLGVDFKSPEGQIAIAAYVLGGHDGDKGTPEQIFLNHYYPIPGGLDARGPDGHTQREYLADMHRLMGIINDAKPGPKPKPPKPGPAKDPYEIITGGVPYQVNYGFRDDEGLNYYAYGVGHGTKASTEHTGDDITVPLGTKLYTPLSGVVICVGNNGTGAWGQSCGSFVDEMTGGAGNISIITDAGVKLTFGHSGKPFVRSGERVEAGQLLCLAGGAGGGAHCHLDVVENRNGSYWLVDPKPALQKVMGQAVTTKPLITGIQWVGTMNFESRNGIVPCAIVFHVTDDMSYTNVRNHFQNPGSDASSHFVIDRDGTKYQFVGSKDGAWTNGEIRSPRTDIEWLNDAVKMDRMGRANINQYTLTLEFVGKPNIAFEKEQIAAGIEIARYYTSIYPIPVNRGHFLRHADIDSINRPYCPGELFPLDEIIRACGGDPLVLNP
jgi:hypothetical protein